MTDEMASGGSPHKVDVHVGAIVRELRRSIPLSQTALGACVGLTFQQIQKYETGKNRISASILYEIARALNVGVEVFFEGLSDTQPPGMNDHSAEASALNFIKSVEGREFAANFVRIKRADHRREIANLVRSLANT